MRPGPARRRGSSSAGRGPRPTTAARFSRPCTVTTRVTPGSPKREPTSGTRSPAGWRRVCDDRRRSGLGGELALHANAPVRQGARPRPRPPAAAGAQRSDLAWLIRVVSLGRRVIVEFGPRGRTGSRRHSPRLRTAPASAASWNRTGTGSASPLAGMPPPTPARPPARTGPPLAVDRNLGRRRAGLCLPRQGYQGLGLPNLPIRVTVRAVRSLPLAAALRPFGGASPPCLGQPAVGAAEFVGWWEPSRVKGGRQILVWVSGESPSIWRQIRAPAASTSTPSATQTEVIARGQRSWTASWPVSSIRPRSRPRGRWASR